MITCRAVKHETPTATIREWSCGDFLVAELLSKYGLPKRYLVIEQLSNGNQVVRSHHRKKSTAVRQAERFERGEA